MISIEDRNNGNCLVSLTGELTIYEAAKLHGDLLDCLTKYENIDIDLSGVTELDTSCYQLLLQAKLKHSKENKQFHISAISDAASEVFELFNLNDVLNNPNQETTH